MFQNAIDKVKNLTWKGWLLVVGTTIVAFLQAAGVVDLTEWIPKLAAILTDAPTPTP